MFVSLQVNYYLHLPIEGRCADENENEDVHLHHLLLQKRGSNPSVC
jgi:hypothetical protein